MGDRHNRKRTRHRPVRRQRLMCCQQQQQLDTNSTAFPSTLPISNPESPATCTCWRPTARPSQSSNSTRSSAHSGPSAYTYSNPSTLNAANANIKSTKSKRAVTPETPRTRSRRVFGGIDSPDGEEFAELCGPMLDVVLGLFGGVDYEDE